MSTAEVEAAAEAPIAKKRGKLPLILGLGLVLAAASGGGFFFMQKKATKPVAAQGEEAGDEHAEVPADEQSAAPADGHGEAAKGASSSDFFALAPQFVVNLNDEEAMRFLQIEVQVIAKKTAAMDAVRANDPIVRNRLMLLFSSQTYHALLTREGKEKLQLDAMAEINKVLAEQKKPHVNGVVFTNFVMQ